MANLCFLIYDFTKTGGAERASAKLMNELVKNHDITMISIFNKYDKFGYDLDKNIKSYRIIDTEASISKTIVKTSCFVRKYVKKEKCNYLIAIDIATALIGLLGSFLMPMKFILCDRSSVYNDDIYSKLNLRLYGWLGIHACSIYQVMTEAGKIGCIEKYHIKNNKVKVIPNWIDDTAIKDVPYNFDNKRIITVGRAATEKNYEYLIDIAERIKFYSKGWEWHIWGDFENEYGEHLLNEIKKRKLSDFLIYKGVTRNIYDVYKNYSMFVLTSRFEGMPNVLLEARGSKLPIIAFDCKTGPAELIVDGQNGFLVQMNDKIMMEERILTLIKNKSLAEKMSNNWDLDIEKYYKEDVLKKWEQIFI